jgi:hypothetical protein
MKVVKLVQVREITDAPDPRDGPTAPDKAEQFAAARGPVTELHIQRDFNFAAVFG